MIIDTENLVSVEQMLSSTTYPTGYFNKCVYCNKDVENDYFEYNSEFYQPYRCNCEKAKEELKLKEEILSKCRDLEKLNENIDSDYVNKQYFEMELRDLKDKYNIKE